MFLQYLSSLSTALRISFFVLYFSAHGTLVKSDLVNKLQFVDKTEARLAPGSVQLEKEWSWNGFLKEGNVQRTI